MKAQVAALLFAFFLAAGCASTDVANKDTLNEPSDRFAAAEDRLPPNPNRPMDNREQKATPTILQKDPALDKPTDREDKGLAVNSGPDQFVRPQDPTQAEDTPKAVGGPATPQPETVNSADTTLVARVKEALAAPRKADPNAEPEVAANSTNGENKGIANIEVTAKNGIVTLSGSVKSEAERTSLEQRASRLPGVLSVNNYLVVPKTDRQ